MNKKIYFLLIFFLFELETFRILEGNKKEELVNRISRIIFLINYKFLILSKELVIIQASFLTVQIVVWIED